MGHCASWVFRCLLFQLMHHVFHRQQERPRSPSAQRTLSTWVTYHSNLKSLFSENKLLESIFFVAVFLSCFFTCHLISHEIKTVIWITQKYTLPSYYNNDFTPSKKNSCTTTFQTSSSLYQR